MLARRLKMENDLQTVPVSYLESDMSMMPNYVSDFGDFLQDSEVPSPTNIYANSYFMDPDYSLLTNSEDSYTVFKSTSISMSNDLNNSDENNLKLFELKPSNNLTALQNSLESQKQDGCASAEAVAMLESFASAVCDVQIKKEPIEMPPISHTNCRDYNSNVLNVEPKTEVNDNCVTLDETEGNFETMQSLIIDHVTKDIDVASASLGISTDPTAWNREDVRKWILYTLRKYSLPMIRLEYFDMDGVTLSSLSEYDFRQRTSLQCGGNLYAHLDIWKTAANLHKKHQPPAPTPSPKPVQSLFQPDDSLVDMSSYLQWTVGNSPSPASIREGSITPDNCLQVPDFNKVSGTTSDYSSDGGFQSDDDNSEDGLEAEKIVRQGSHSHIHLWQFLKELLLHPQMYGSCIRWLDRTKGVFKIEDSVRVARLWGKRKNRPAMNYDKLSRSIRQYYKKGIMKKTERSQRLVYQFCHPYCL